MTVTRVSLKKAIKMALLPYPGLPKWKAWRLRHPERDKEQRRGYRERNREIIAEKARERYARDKQARLTLTPAQRMAKSKGVD
jgi:hypothetical protein